MGEEGVNRTWGSTWREGKDKVTCLIPVRAQELDLRGESAQGGSSTEEGAEHLGGMLLFTRWSVALVVDNIS